MIEWSIKKFNQISTYELFNILYERTKIFVVEQNRSYQEVDEIDLTALHLFGYSNNKIVAYSRIYQKVEVVTFGRVLIVAQQRGQGLGKELMEQIFLSIDEYFPTFPILIEAQSDKQGYYEQFGFHVVGDSFIYNQTPHIQMRKHISLPS